LPRMQPRTTWLRGTIRITAGLGLLLAGGVLAATAGGPALAASSSGSTTARVSVNSTITLSGLPANFTLTGDPSTTVTSNGAVTMNVLTDNLLGYSVTVQAAAATLAGSAGNTDTIPIADLKARETGGAVFTPLSNLVPLLVHSQVTRSGSSGDTISNDYQVVIPFVSADTYTVTLNYVASTL
jgi:hypothetical protein